MRPFKYLTLGLLVSLVSVSALTAPESAMALGNGVLDSSLQDALSRPNARSLHNAHFKVLLKVNGNSAPIPGLEAVAPSAGIYGASLTRREIEELAGSGKIVAMGLDEKLRLEDPQDMASQSLAVEEVGNTTQTPWGPTLKPQSSWLVGRSEIPADTNHQYPSFPAIRTALNATGSGDGKPLSYSTRDTVVAVVDSGVDSRHIDLDGGKVLTFKSFVSAPDKSCPAMPTTRSLDSAFHGTNVAGIIAGSGDSGHPGVAPGAAIVSLRVFDCTGSGDTSDVLRGLQWIQDNPQWNIKVANLSLGGGTAASVGTDALSLMVNKLTAAGITMVVAAGNSGPNHGTVGYPAAAQYALTVGAIASAAVGGPHIATFSSRGPVAGTINGKPDLVAPGVDVQAARANPYNFSATTPLKGFITYSGTSQATPFVAGLSALALAINPALKPTGTIDAGYPDGVRDMSTPLADLMRTTARDLGVSGADPVYGHGLVSPANLLYSAAKKTQPQNLALNEWPWVSAPQDATTTDEQTSRVFQVRAKGGVPLVVSVDTGLPKARNTRSYNIEVRDSVGRSVFMYAAQAFVEDYDRDNVLTTYRSTERGGPLRSFTSFKPVAAGEYTIIIQSVGDVGVQTVMLGGIVPNSSPVDYSSALTLPHGTVTEGSTTVLTLNRNGVGPYPSNKYSVSLYDTTGVLSFSPQTVQLDSSTSVNITVKANASPRREGRYRGNIFAKVVPVGVSTVSWIPLESPTVTDSTNSTSFADEELVEVGPGARITRSTDSMGDMLFQHPFISDSGRFVAYTASTRVLPGDTLPERSGSYKPHWKAYRYDRSTGVTSVIPSEGSSSSIVVVEQSSDGRYVLLASEGSVRGEGFSSINYYKYDTNTDTLTLVSTNSAGSTPVGSGVPADPEYAAAAISNDGRYVVFETMAALVPEDVDPYVDIYRKDTQTGQTVRMSRPTSGVGGGSSVLDLSYLTISSDGQTVFASTTRNLLAADTDSDSRDIYKLSATAAPVRLSKGSFWFTRPVVANAAGTRAAWIGPDTSGSLNVLWVWTAATGAKVAPLLRQGGLSDLSYGSVLAVRPDNSIMLVTSATLDPALPFVSPEHIDSGPALYRVDSLNRVQLLIGGAFNDGRMAFTLPGGSSDGSWVLGYSTAQASIRGSATSYPDDRLSVYAYSTRPRAQVAAYAGLNIRKGSIKGGNIVTIRGSNLTKGIEKITVDGRKPPSVGIKSQSITIRMPAHKKGVVNVQVRDIYGGTYTFKYTYS